MSWVRVVGVVIAAVGVGVHVYIARRYPPIRWLVTGGAVLEAIGVTVLAATR
ncbi:MAG TPA: hypothetical protein VMW04_03480 [Patescibacteria group bacterium]|nr:hypothetical protein [Patescibacteria group bacterium]